MKCKKYKGVGVNDESCRRMKALGKTTCADCEQPAELAKKEEAKMAKETKCKGCNETKKIVGRGLCGKCYHQQVVKKKKAKAKGKGRKPGRKFRDPGPAVSLFHVDANAIRLNPDAPTDVLVAFRDQINGILDARLQT